MAEEPSMVWMEASEYGKLRAKEIVRMLLSICSIINQQIEE